ncbi:hypothetical protein F511_20091 [Dorcoceras hygrometricum]|uniref:Uncharacterized protein n=1 Tax=Dorcoceras hygrometricum TaxID=472368 RepID=A0A2Z7BNG7_9LAMI|nr:hypothetical protein F511_20091 [Dorcoceras hygrometricum]
MSTMFSTDIAEVYVLRKLNREKMKRPEVKDKEDDRKPVKEENKRTAVHAASSSCFPHMIKFKKIHPR